ncbi:MAG: tetratricopeptide repeat protein [Candidatus Heimdallarchaeota archaeon]|nr:tetratricopeptide repeat protein [Candidatus Heimdallarchaeota archaeon]
MSEKKVSKEKTGIMKTTEEKDNNTKNSDSPSKKATSKPKTKTETKLYKTEELGDIDDSLLIDGITYIEQNKLDTALECFDDFCKKYPDNHFGWYYVGYTKMLQNKKKDAMKNFKKATKIDNKFLPSLYYQGLLEFENNDFPKALIIFDDIMERFNSDEIKDSNFNIPYFIAICHHYLGNFQRAEEYFLFAYNLTPEDPVVLYYKGFNEVALKNYDYASETFKNLLYVDINNQQFWDLIKGYMYYYHQHEEAKED